MSTVVTIQQQSQKLNRKRPTAQFSVSLIDTITEERVCLSGNCPVPIEIVDNGVCSHKIINTFNGGYL